MRRLLEQALVRLQEQLVLGLVRVRRLVQEQQLLGQVLVRPLVLVLVQVQVQQL